jgi:GMP synthase-like glutamine amidotransferase
LGIKFPQTPAFVPFAQGEQFNTLGSFNMSPTRIQPPLRVAILLNSYRSPFITEIRDSYVRSIGAVAGDDAELTFFLPAEKPDDFPDPDAFDLIVVGGGNADPRKRHTWILRVHEFILDVVANHPRTKLCGICWGHQTISMLFGAELVDMEMPEVRQTRT